MHKFLLLCLTVFQLNVLNAQLSCDSTYAVCDSITIDTVLFTHNEFGDRIHVKIRSEHSSIYAPVFRICPEDGSIQFENPDFGLFGIGGPATIYLYYQFENFDFSAETFNGEIISGNSNNLFSDCRIAFSAPTGNTPNGLDENSVQNELIISPNPVSQHLSVRLRNADFTIQSIRILDNEGRQYSARFSNNLVDLSAVPPGLFILKVTLNDGQQVTQKVIKQ